MGDVLLQRCGGCKVEKPLEAFSPGYRGKLGAWCNGCFADLRNGEWKPTAHEPRICETCGSTYTPKQIKVASGGDFCSKRCRRAAMRKAERLADPKGLRARDRGANLKRLYGPDSAVWYGEQLARQCGLCAICGKPPKDGECLHIDHDHLCCQKRSCGRCLRGLLCNACNRAIGLLGDDPEILVAAARYIRRHRSR